MMYKLKDGDIIKILPIIKKDGSFSFVEELSRYTYVNETM
jgi:hypothetical protein